MYFLLFTRVIAVSYEEFKEMFQEEQRRNRDKIYSPIEGDMEDDDDGLLGLNANIPGGKYDVHHV